MELGAFVGERGRGRVVNDMCCGPAGPMTEGEVTVGERDMLGECTCGMALLYPLISCSAMSVSVCMCVCVCTCLCV